MSRGDEATDPPWKKIKSVPPDLIVSVGSGQSKQEFECYKVVLCFASDFFDSVLCPRMKEGTLSKIEFPTRDPREWKLFYEFIHPAIIGMMFRDEINEENALKLLPWFDEFEMSDELEECRQIEMRRIDAEIKRNKDQSQKIRSLSSPNE